MATSINFRSTVTTNDRNNYAAQLGEDLKQKVGEIADLKVVAKEATAKANTKQFEIDTDDRLLTDVIEKINSIKTSDAVFVGYKTPTEKGLRVVRLTKLTREECIEVVTSEYWSAKLKNKSANWRANINLWGVEIPRDGLMVARGRLRGEERVSSKDVVLTAAKNEQLNSYIKTIVAEDTEISAAVEIISINKIEKMEAAKAAKAKEVVAASTAVLKGTANRRAELRKAI